jgi:prepilin peptidase CpaA
MHSYAWWPTLFVLTVATITDLRSRRIPNWLVLPFLIVGVGVSSWLYGWHGLGRSVAGIGLGILIYGIFFCLGGMGAGDVKLCAAVGAWIGPEQLFIALVLTGLAGGVMVLCWAGVGGFLKELLKGTHDLLRDWTGCEPSEGQVNVSRRKMPYAPAIAIGTVISFIGR